jgi:hypothetical protein
MNAEMTIEYRFEMAQRQIDLINYQITSRKKDIERENRSIQKYLESGDYHWLGIASERMSERAQEIQALMKTRYEMQEMLDFIMGMHNETSI